MQVLTLHAKHWVVLPMAVCLNPPSGAEAASVGQPCLRAAAVRPTAVECPFAHDPLSVNPPAPMQPVDGKQQSVNVPASSKRKLPDPAEHPDGANTCRACVTSKMLCQKAIQHDLSDPERVDALSDAAKEVVEAFGVNYYDDFDEVYTRQGAPAFIPRIKIMMEACSICGLLQVNSHSNAILNAFIMSNGSRSDHLTTTFNCQNNKSQIHCAMQ
ncbi:TPA: hypothetical protein ACH3X2_002499 [Trebouxia sp. C0005]